MEKRNVAEEGRTRCAFCGRTAVMFVADTPTCEGHVALVKSGSAETPLKDAAPSLIRKWAGK